MKKLTVCLFATILFLTCTPTSLFAGEETHSADSTQTMASAKVLLVRMDVINTMDKTHMKASELKALKKELRGIKGELKELDGGTYLPVGSLIILLLVPLVGFNLTQ